MSTVFARQAGVPFVVALSGRPITTPEIFTLYVKGPQDRFERPLAMALDAGGASCSRMLAATDFPVAGRYRVRLAELNSAGDFSRLTDPTILVVSPAPPGGLS